MSETGSKPAAAFVRPKGIMSMEHLLGGRCFGGGATGAPSLWPAPSALVKSFSQDLVDKCYEPPAGFQTWREVPKFFSLRKSPEKAPAPIISAARAVNKYADKHHVESGAPGTTASLKILCTAALPGGASDAPAIEELKPAADDSSGKPISCTSDSPIRAAFEAPDSTAAQKPCDSSPASRTVATEAPLPQQQLQEPGTGSQCPEEAPEHTDEGASADQGAASSTPVRETAAPPPVAAAAPAAAAAGPPPPPAAAAAAASAAAAAPPPPPPPAAAPSPPAPPRRSKRIQQDRDLDAPGPSPSPTSKQQPPRKSRRVNGQSQEEIRAAAAPVAVVTAGDAEQEEPAAVNPPPPPPPPPPAAAAAAAAAAAPASSQSAERRGKMEPERQHSRDEAPQQQAAASTPLTAQPAEQGRRDADLCSAAAASDAAMDEAEEGELPQQPRDPEGGTFSADDAAAVASSAPKALPSAASRLLALACTEDQTTWGLLGQRSIITRSHLRGPVTQQGAAAADNQGGGGGGGGGPGEEEEGGAASCVSSKGQAQRDRQAVRARIRTRGSAEEEGGALEEEREEGALEEEEEREVGLAVEIKKFAKRAARARYQSHKGGVQKKQQQPGGRAADQTHRGFRGSVGRGRGGAAGRGRGRSQYEYQQQHPWQSSHQQKHHQAGPWQGAPPGAPASALPSRRLAPMPERRQWDRNRSGEHGRQWDDGFSSDYSDRDDEGAGGPRQLRGPIAEADVYASNPLLEEEEKASNNNNNNKTEEAGRGGADAAPSFVRNDDSEPPAANKGGALRLGRVPPVDVQRQPGGAEQDGLCASPANSLLPAPPSWKRLV